MKLKIDWKALGNAAKMAALPVNTAAKMAALPVNTAAKMAALPVKGGLWLTGNAAILAAVIALTDGCSSMTPSSKTQTMGVYAIGVPGIAIITKSTQHEDASGGDTNAPTQTNPVTTTMTTGK